MSADQNPSGIAAGPLQVDRDQGIDRLARPSVILAYADPSAMAPINDAIREPPATAVFRRRRRQRLRCRRVLHLSVEPSIGKMGKIHGAIAYVPSAAAIFVNSRARVERCRRDIRPPAIPVLSNHNVTTLLART